ncbi:MAG: molybdopterin-dependent oxidoreductase [Candidatus Altiarchaeota archaeon]
MNKKAALGVIAFALAALALASMLQQISQPSSTVTLVELELPQDISTSDAVQETLEDKTNKEGTIVQGGTEGENNQASKSSTIPEKATFKPATPKTLADVEVREYQGEKLSSLTDFRENSIAGPQYVNLSGYRLRVTGLVEEPRELSYSEVLDRNRYQKIVTLYCVEGWQNTLLYEGVKIKDLLRQAGLKPEANTVIFYAADGYSSSLPLSYIQNNDILLAYKMNNVTLPPERGFPFFVVAEDKWGYKWVKWVTEIKLSDNPDFKGFWEARGYNNNGDLEGSKWE